MPEQHKALILVADDDNDDCMLLQEAAREANLPAEVCFVHDGECLMDYLYQCDSHTSTHVRSYPDLLLLDLNMPKYDGRDVLRELATNRQLRRLPVVVVSTSRAIEDITLSYSLGARAYIVKPSSFADLVRIIEGIATYWLDTVTLPPAP